MVTDSISSFEQGLEELKRPLLPLIHIVQWLYLSGPFERIAELLAEFNESVEMEHAVYRTPSVLLEKYENELRPLEGLKKSQETDYRIHSEDGAPLDAWEAIGQWTRHLVLVRELESINSLLCGPQGCTLCCTGPAAEDKQSFFEIPLRSEETALFAVRQIDSASSRLASPHDETVFRLDGDRPFYAGEPAIFHWCSGWSLILPRDARCPHLDETGACGIYCQRPEVCRRPQIFPYLLERMPDMDMGEKKSYVLRNKLLAVWDCPYVRKLQEKIAAYAELCGLEPVFRENKV